MNNQPYHALSVRVSFPLAHVSAEAASAEADNFTDSVSKGEDTKGCQAMVQLSNAMS